MYDILCTADDDAPTLSHQTTVFMVSHPFQAWQHSPRSDIAPTVSTSSYRLHWHITHFCMSSHSLLCDIIWTIYNITPNPYVITLLYLWHHRLYIWNHIQYIGPHIHYTCDITTANLCHHSHSIDITHTSMTSHSDKVWHLFHYTRHHVLALWH